MSGHRAWKDPSAPGWSLTLDTSTGEWFLSDIVSARTLPRRWVATATRHSPVLVWFGTAPVYVWTEGTDAYASKGTWGARFANALAWVQS